ncbi:hypothetical protein SODALDRAFT_322868, partial [Sodiomyces alkalinus F11]
YAAASPVRYRYIPDLSPSPPVIPDDNVRLLALDSGSVRGLSSLIILRSLIAAVDPDSPPKLYNYFDIIGGTSTGDLITVILGRLYISVDDYIAAAALKRAIKGILKDAGYDENILLKDTSNGRYRLPRSLLYNLGRYHLLRPYRYRPLRRFRRDKADLDNSSRYFRFNVARGLEDIGLEESKKKAEITAATGRYV